MTTNATSATATTNTIATVFNPLGEMTDAEFEEGLKALFGAPPSPSEYARGGDNEDGQDANADLPPTVDEEWPAIDKMDATDATDLVDPDEFGGDTKETELPQFPDNAGESPADGDQTTDDPNADEDPDYVSFEVGDDDDRPVATSGTIGG